MLASIDAMSQSIRDDAAVLAASAATMGDAALGHLASAVEAILLTTDKATPDSRIADALELGPGGAAVVRSAIESLNEQYARTNRAFRIEKVAGGWRVATTASVAPQLAAFHQRRASTRLSRAAIETLAIIAYRQPIARAQLEAIRGVACGEVLRTLLERDLAAIVGRAEELGRPMLYGTTRLFLEVFGLSSLKDLPTVDGAEFENEADASVKTADVTDEDVATQETPSEIEAKSADSLDDAQEEAQAIVADADNDAAMAPPQNATDQIVDEYEGETG